LGVSVAAPLKFYFKTNQFEIWPIKIGLAQKQPIWSCELHATTLMIFFFKIPLLLTLKMPKLPLYNYEKVKQFKKYKKAF
jgi:hypothetical protein